MVESMFSVELWQIIDVGRNGVMRVEDDWVPLLNYGDIAYNEDQGNPVYEYMDSVKTVRGVEGAFEHCQKLYDSGKKKPFQRTVFSFVMPEVGWVWRVESKYVGAGGWWFFGCVEGFDSEIGPFSLDDIFKTARLKQLSLYIKV